MNPQDQAENYDKIADHWNSTDFNRANGISQHQRAFQFSKRQGAAIDVGCGSSGRIIDLLLSEGFETEGLDASEEMLRLAKLRHTQVQFHHSDICQWKPLKKYAFISAWDSIWHVPLDSQELVLQKLLNSLEPCGVVIFTTGAVDEPGESSSPYLGQALYHAVLGVPAIMKILIENGCVCRHLENDDWPNKHLYIVAQRSA